MQWLIGSGAFAVWACLYYLYSYNSGYGYDALEYILLARSLADGHASYSFIPSKGPGIYAVGYTWLSAGLTLDHKGLSALITLAAAALLLLAASIAYRLYNGTVAFFTAVWIALCMAFMEMNFLETEQFMALAALAALYCIAKAERDCTLTSLKVLGAAVTLGVAMLFKAAAAFYLVGLLGYLVHTGRPFWRRSFWRCTTAVAGFCLPPLLACAYFADTGRFHEHVFWTYTFPLFYYPANTLFLSKLYTKLIWFFAALIVASVYSVRGRAAAGFWKDPAMQLAAWMGGVSLCALLKTQASHYVYPAAAVLALLIAKVAACMVEQTKLRKTAPIAVAFVLAVSALFGSAYIYRPSVFARFFGLRSFSEESDLKRCLTNWAGKERTVLAFRDSALVYWLSGTYPVIPVVNTNVQTTWWITKHPTALADAIDDSGPNFIEFCPRRPAYDDPDGLRNPLVKTALAAFETEVIRNYDRALSCSTGYCFWEKHQ
jgi:hypothetical protein